MDAIFSFLDLVFNYLKNPTLPEAAAGDFLLLIIPLSPDFSYTVPQVITCGIWLFFFNSAIRHWLKIGKKKRALRALDTLYQRLEQEDQLNISKINEVMNEEEFEDFKPAWDDFWNHLETDKPDEYTFTESVEKNFTSENSIEIKQDYPHKLDESFNYYVSLGIFGTFLGIVLSLKGLQLDPQNIERSIQPLLDGIYLSFRTSIWGIGLASFLGRSNSNVERKIERGFHRLHRLLQPKKANYKLRESENLLAEILNCSKEQLILVQHLSTEITDKIDAKLQPLFSGIGSRIDALPAQVSEAFKPLVNQLSDEFEKFAEENSESVNKTLEQIREATDQAQSDSMNQVVSMFMEKMNESMGDMFGNLSNTLGRNIEMIETMQGNIQDISGQLSNSADQLQTIFKSTGSQAEQLDGAAKILTEKGTEFAHTIETINQYQTGISEMMNDIHSHREQDRKEFEDRMQQLHSFEKSNVDSAKAQQEILKSLQPVSQDLASFSVDLVNAGKGLTEATGQIEKSNTEQTNLLGNLQKLTETCGTNISQLEGVSAKLNDFSQEIKTSFGEFSSMNEELRKVVESGGKVSEKLKKWLDQVNNVFQSISHTEQALQDLYKNNQQLVQGTEESFTKLKNNIEHIVVQLPESLNLSFQSFDKEMSQIAGYMKESLETFQTAVEEVSEIGPVINQTVENLKSSVIVASKSVTVASNALTKANSTADNDLNA